MRKSTDTATFLLAWALLTGGSARAFENVCTHPEMARKGRALLSRGSSPFNELLAHEERIAAGADQEDTIKPAPLVPAVLEHFYHAPTGTALHVPGLSAFMNRFFSNARERGVDHWAAALKRYKADDKAEAYFLLGRSLHLMQDMHQPGHVHNDPHVPPEGAGGLLDYVRGLNGHDLSPLEKTVESGCEGFPRGSNIPAGNSVGAPRPGAPAGPAGFIVSSAQEAYESVYFSGSLPATDSGNTGNINVSGKTYSAGFVDAVRKDTLSGDDVRGGFNECLTQRHWILKEDLSNNADRGLCFVQNKAGSPYEEFDGGLFNGFDNDWWPIAPGRFYIEQYDDVRTSTNEFFMDFL